MWIGFCTKVGKIDPSSHKYFTWFPHLSLSRPDLDSQFVFDFFSAIPLSARPDVQSSERGRRVRYKPTLAATVSNVESRLQVRRHYESTKLTTTGCRCCCCRDVVVVVDVLRCCHCLRVVAGLRLLLGQKKYAIKCWFSFVNRSSFLELTSFLIYINLFFNIKYAKNASHDILLVRVVVFEVVFVSSSIMSIVDVEEELARPVKYVNDFYKCSKIFTIELTIFSNILHKFKMGYKQRNNYFTLI